MWYFNKLIMAWVELFFFTCSKSEQIRCFISKDYEPIYIAGSENGAQMNTLKICYAKVSITEINEWSKTYKNCTQAYTLFELTHKYMFFPFLYIGWIFFANKGQMAGYALVLFDVDGCTAIVDSKKLVLEGKDLVNGQQGYMKFGAEKLKVEILQLSGNISLRASNQKCYFLVDPVYILL